MIYREIEKKVRDHEKRFQSNKSLVIGASQFVNNSYTWTHGLNNDDLMVNVIDTTTNEPLVPDYKILDKNNILIRNSVEHPNIKVVLSASYDKGATVTGASVEDFAGDSIGVGAKQVRIKDNSGVVKNPITDSDSVYMTDGTTKLTKKIGDITTSLEQKTNIEVTNKLKSQFDNIIIKSGNSEAEIIQSRDGWINLNNKLENLRIDDVYDNNYIKEKKDLSYVFSSDITSITNYNRVFILTDESVKKGIKFIKFKTLSNLGSYKDFTLYLFRKIDENTYSIVYKNTINVLDGNAIFTDILVNEELYIGFKGEVQYTLSKANLNVYTTYETNISDNILSSGSKEVLTPNLVIELFTDNIIPTICNNVDNLNKSLSDIRYNYKDLQETKTVDYTNSFEENSGGITNINRIFIPKNLSFEYGIKSLKFKIKPVNGIYENVTLYILKKISDTLFEVKDSYVLNTVDGVASIDNIFYGEEFYIGISGNVQYKTVGDNLQPFYNPFKSEINNNSLSVADATNIALNCNIIYYSNNVIISQFLNDIESLKNEILELKMVNCFGDSLTYGAGSSAPKGGYVTRLNNLLGNEWKVSNFGVGGEKSNVIAARQGGMDFVLQPNVTIPSTISEVSVSIKTNDGQEAQLRNPINCSINGIEGILKNNTEYNGNIFVRKVVGEEIKITRPTNIITEQSRVKSEVSIFFVGQNGGFNNDVNYLVNQYRYMADYHSILNKNNKVLFIGLHTGDNESRNPLEEAMFKEFGRKYINIRKYMGTPIYDELGEITSTYACEDLGLTPTEKDLRLLKNYGYIPLDVLTVDGTHFNDGTYDVLTKLIYNRGIELGYW